jgi:hypothetical protein
MRYADEDIRREIRDRLLSRAWYTDELAAKLGINPSTCSSIILELQESGIPICPWEGGRKMTIYPKGRTCEVCGAILSTKNPCGVCNLHGGGVYPDEDDGTALDTPENPR